MLTDAPPRSSDAARRSTRSPRCARTRGRTRAARSTRPPCPRLRTQRSRRPSRPTSMQLTSACRPARSSAPASLASKMLGRVSAPAAWRLMHRPPRRLNAILSALSLETRASSFVEALTALGCINSPDEKGSGVSAFRMFFVYLECFVWLKQPHVLRRRLNRISLASCPTSIPSTNLRKLDALSARLALVADRKKWIGAPARAPRSHRTGDNLSRYTVDSHGSHRDERLWATAKRASSTVRPRPSTALKTFKTLKKHEVRRLGRRARHC